MRINSGLTALMASVYFLSIESTRAVSGLRRNAERSVLVFRAITPECSTNREAWTALVGRDNTRVFYLPGIGTTRRINMTQKCWYQPQTACEAADAIENVRFIVCFLSDTIAQEGLKPGSGIRLSECGSTGLYQIYSFIEDVLDNCNNKMRLKEVRV